LFCFLTAILWRGGYLGLVAISPLPHFFYFFLLNNCFMHMERRNVHIFGNCYIKEDLLAKTNNQRVHSIIGVLSSLELYYFFFVTLLCSGQVIFLQPCKIYKNTRKLKVWCIINKEFLKYWDCDTLDNTLKNILRY
jgi:hypothetical protein